MSWDKIFSEVFEKVKQGLERNYRRGDPEEITPNEKAILLGASKLPCKIEIINVDCSKSGLSGIDNVSQLIKYNLTSTGKLNVRDYGIVLFNKNEIFQSIVKLFKENTEHATFISEQLMIHSGESGFPKNDGTYIEFTGYDIRKDIEKFTDDLITKFYSTFNDYFVIHFKMEKDIDFNSLYELKNDLILSPNELLKPDSRTNTSLENLQSTVADIQLIPQVPEPVKVEFQYAKDLYVFSYFKYGFATLADRSALFAFETAVKMKYIQSLNRKATVTYKSELIHELSNPTHYSLSEFIFAIKNQQKCKLKDILVNGERFPLTMKELMNWIISKGFPKWKFRLYDASRKLRNSFAHPENVIILPPSNGILRRVANDINEMFQN